VTTPSAATIYSFPYAGGGAGSYRSFAASFPAEAGSIVAVELPGRGKRAAESFADTAEHCVQRCVDQVEAGYADYLLHGHSMGAVLAFECLKLLQRQQARLPLFLVVSGRNAPLHANQMGNRVLQLDDRALFQDLQASGAVPKGLNLAMASGFLRVIRNDLQMVQDYAPDPIPVSVPILVLAGRGDEMTNHQALLDWQDHTSGRAVLHYLDGGHYFIFNQASAVAEAITAFRTSLGGRA
jgi:surfactin synthase thioesterase subunit